MWSLSLKTEPLILYDSVIFEDNMARKRYAEDDILRLACQVEGLCNSGMNVVTACCAAGVLDKTYYDLRRKCGGMSRAPLAEMKDNSEPESATSSQNWQSNKRTATQRRVSMRCGSLVAQGSGRTAP